MKIWYKTVAVIINRGLKEIIRNKSLSFFPYLELEVANLAVNTIKAQGSQLERIDAISIFFVSFFTEKDFFFSRFYTSQILFTLQKQQKNKEKIRIKRIFSLSYKSTFLS